MFPDHPSWDEAREAYNLTVDQQPAAIAFPADARDVQEIVRYAAANGLRVAPQRTGHNASPDHVAGGRRPPEDRRARHRRDRCRCARRPASVPASSGSPSSRAASELGLAALHGSTPDVSIVGYGLGGGRRLVRAQARPVHEQHHRHRARHRRRPAAAALTRDNDPELFWALRGGGGSFGVVTALEFRLFPIAEVYAGALFFPWERAAEVLHAWREWVETVPDEVTSVGRILQFPPLEAVPLAVPRQGVRGPARLLARDGEGGRRAARAAARRSARRSTPSAMVPPVELVGDAHGPARPPAVRG